MTCGGTGPSGRRRHGRGQSDQGNAFRPNADQGWPAGSDIRIGGKVEGKVKAAGSTVTIGGDAVVRAHTIRIMASAQMDGDLTYRSQQKVEIYPDAQIADDITFIRSGGPRHLMDRTFAALGAIGFTLIVGAVLVGVIRRLTIPEFTAVAAGTIPKRR